MNFSNLVVISIMTITNIFTNSNSRQYIGNMSYDDDRMPVAVCPCSINTNLIQITDLGVVMSTNAYDVDAGEFLNAFFDHKNTNFSYRVKQWRVALDELSKHRHTVWFTNDIGFIDRPLPLPTANPDNPADRAEKE